MNIRTLIGGYWAHFKGIGWRQIDAGLYRQHTRVMRSPMIDKVEYHAPADVFDAWLLVAFWMSLSCFCAAAAVKVLS